MRLLLDTHVLILFINGDKKLPVKSRKLISDPDNLCFLSIASIWEIAIKLSLGKLELQSDFAEITHILIANHIEVMPISFEHLQTLLKLEYHHRDPFDRIMISQGISENMAIVSKDDIFTSYPVKLIWK